MLSKEESNIAGNIKRLMDDQDVSLRQLEKLTGVNHVTIHGFLQGKHSPRVSAVCAIARALGVELSDLLAPPSKSRPKASVA